MVAKKWVKALLLAIIVCNFSCTNDEPEPIREIEKVLVDVGDSLTAGYGGFGISMSSVTSDLLGPTWEVVNSGVGGENTLTIGARYGSMPMIIKESIVFPAGSTRVAIPSGLYSSYNGSPVYPLLQGEGDINPCTLKGISNTNYSLVLDAGIYYLERENSIDFDLLIPIGSQFITSLSKRREGVATFFIGQNGGYGSPEEFLAQIDRYVLAKGDPYFIIITSHGSGIPEYVAPVIAKYGDKVIDLQTYMVTDAVDDALELGLLPDDGTYPTAQDLNFMSLRRTPPSLLHDQIHLNAIGYELLGRLRYEKGRELGYW
ncbi:MAG: hypothetical protein WBA16_04465 [Nonlabens sp.]